MHSLSYVGFVLLLLGESIFAQDSSSQQELPIVDLGYTRQEASSFNTTGGYYNFTNIRYGEPPVGDLRFAAPVAAKANDTLQQGGDERICMQANPAWTLFAAKWLPLYLAGNKSAFNEVILEASQHQGASEILPQNSYETEDCLFLDVSVPQSIFAKRNGTSSTSLTGIEGSTSATQFSTGAPVMVWIFGGGYTFGSKNYWGSGAGLLNRSVNGMIYVTINYRLGAFGWLSGSEFEASNGTSNAGLLDQRLALEWVQKYIHLFGGDPNQVTVAGESAGGGSIMHHITAYGGTQGRAPFQRAITQSAAWLPITANKTENKNFEDFLKAANVTTLEELRSLPLDKLRFANSGIVEMAPYGQYGFGPAVDGTYVPDLPGKLLLNGSFDKSIQIMVGHNADEGLRFTSPYLQSDFAIRDNLIDTFPTASNNTIDYVIRELYPPILPSPLYNDSIARAALITAEATFSCNARYLAKAFGNESYNYLFAVPPALHGQDIPYTFYNGPAPAVVASDVAGELQGYITGFVVKGDPGFEAYGEGNVRALTPGSKGPAYIPDPVKNDRCEWWQMAHYEDAVQ